MSSAWDPSHTESPKWAASRMGNSGFVRSPSSRPSGGKLGACLPPSSPTDSETLPASLPDSLGTQVEPLALDLGVCGAGCRNTETVLGEERTATGPADNGQRMEPPSGVSCRKRLCLCGAVLGGQ